MLTLSRLEDEVVPCNRKDSREGTVCKGGATSLAVRETRIKIARPGTPRRAEDSLHMEVP